jgi:hypothetical protein
MADGYKEQGVSSDMEGEGDLNQGSRAKGPCLQRVLGRKEIPEKIPKSKKKANFDTSTPKNGKRSKTILQKMTFRPYPRIAYQGTLCRENNTHVP